MSDKIELMPCKCGGEAEDSIFLKRANNKLACDLFAKRCNGDNCLCETPTYATEAEAAEAWRVMQTALQAGWTSEVPSEAGEYWFVGVMGENFPVSRNYNFDQPTHASIDENLEVSLSVFVAPIKNLRGMWQKAIYPQPPQDTDNGKD